VKRAWLTIAALAAISAPIGLAGGARSSLEPLPQSFCSPVVYRGTGQPRFLIASDLPVRAFRFREAAVQMQKAIEFILARHRFRAGKFGVAYQACDDSNPETGQGDLTKCAANAKAYAEDASLIGLVGTWSSPCTAAELATLNRTPTGPLALVSPTNTGVGLTHKGPGTEPGEPGRFYPTGRRSFARIISADDAQGAADAVLAKHLHRKRVFVLDDGESYGFTVVLPFLHAARLLRLKVVGRASWAEDQTDFVALARQVARAKPDAVFLGGFACPGCSALIKQLRAALGSKPDLIAPDGWSLDDYSTLGPASRRMYVSIPGLPAGRMGSLGRQIAARYGAGRLGSGGPPYAAQATEVVLAAIAHSSGTRLSVTNQLYKLRYKNLILPSFRFDRSGDPSYNPVSVFRISGKKGKLVQVVAATPKLIR
jgi:branched-chain amino acid transport system substrate-binding protein